MFSSNNVLERFGGVSSPKKQSKDNDDGDWHTQQPEQYSATHDLALI
jgi:hypothetical protein